MGAVARVTGENFLGVGSTTAEQATLATFFINPDRRMTPPSIAIATKLQLCLQHQTPQNSTSRWNPTQYQDEIFSKRAE